jgi:capsular polysaccharide biosynthesis protein
VTVKIKMIRAKLGRFIRKTGKALSLPAYGPISVRHGKPEGAKTVDEERTKVAVPSRPVLPKIHPLLATNPISYRSTWVAKFKGLRVFGPTVSVVDEGGELLVDVSVEWGRKAEENWAFRRLLLPKPHPVNGRTLVLASTGGDTYFHWITDVLPRLGLARRGGYDPESFDWVLVNGLTHPFQEETLEHIGISKNRCLSFNKTELAYEIEEALLPSLPGVPGVVPPETVDFLRNTFSTEKNSRSRKIFIGRSGAKHRVLIHEKEIWAQLQNRGFDSVDCGKMSVQEQANIFGSAEVVVGAHGAALTNLVFCRPGTPVVELFSPAYVNPCYRDLCVAAGLRHAAVIGNGKDWVLSERHDQPSGPITASWELVEEALAEIAR